MTNTFTFSNPDGTIQVLDAETVRSCNLVLTRQYGLDLAARYSDVCTSFCCEANRLFRERTGKDEDVVPAEESGFYIGLRLGQLIQRHIRRSDDSANIWAEVWDLLDARMSEELTSAAQCSVVVNADYESASVRVESDSEGRHVTVDVPLEDAICRRIILPRGISYPIVNDTTPSSDVSEDEKEVEYAAGLFVADYVIESFPDILHGNTREHVRDMIAKQYLTAWLNGTDLDLSDF